MKLVFVVIGMVYASLVFALFPFVFIRLNNHFNLPIFSNIFLDVLGCLLLLIGVIVSTISYPLFWSVGKGSPVPINPTKNMIEVGLYKYSRNPIYMSHFLLIFGGSLILGYSLLFLYTLFCFIAYNFYIMWVEEPELRKRFGSSYSEYCNKVTRWL